MTRRKKTKPTKMQPAQQRPAAAIVEPPVQQQAAPAVEQPKHAEPPSARPQAVPPWHWSVVPGVAYQTWYRSQKIAGSRDRKDPLSEISPDKKYVDPKTYDD